MNRIVLTPVALGAAILLVAAAQPKPSPIKTAPRPAPVATPAPSQRPAPAMETKRLPPKRAERRKHRRASPALAKVVVATRRATMEPVRAGYVNAAQIYPYTEGAIYRAYTAPERITDITLQPGEVLGSVAAGDTARWVIGDTSSGAGESKRTHVLVKPFAAGLSTNVVIATDRRSYHLSLVSTATAAMTAISWTYPQDELIAVKTREEQAQAAAPIAQGLAVEQLRFDYTISGDTPPWRPLRAFDDGRQTFIEFPAALVTGEAPPLFVLGPKNEAELVNYRVRGRYYIVDRLFGAAELRLGTKHQDIVRITRNDVRATRRGRRAS